MVPAAEITSTDVVRETTVADLMGGVGRLTVVVPPDCSVADAEELLRQGAQRLRSLEGLWSRFLPTSEITTLNLAGGRPVKVSADTITLVTSMVSAWHLTRGYVNASALPDVMRAGYEASMLNPALITAMPPQAAARGQMSDITIDDSQSMITLPRGMTLDPGGIGKGLAADLVCEQLLGAGAGGALVEVSGDLRVAGTPPTASGWFIDIADPRNHPEAVGTVALMDGGVATSSVLRRRWLGPNGVDRHHLIGRDGAPAHSGLATSSTVVGTGAMAEILAKVPLLVGEVRGLDLLNQWGVPALCVRLDGTVVTSDAWQEVAA